MSEVVREESELEDGHISGREKTPNGGKPGSLTLAVCLALAAALFMKLFLFDFMITEGRSMVPSIQPGKILLVSKLAFGLRVPGTGKYLARWALPKTGEIVVFWTPLGDIAVKRVGAIVEGTSFMALGDNEAISYDSRTYGPVPLDNIIGRVLDAK